MRGFRKSRRLGKGCFSDSAVGSQNTERRTGDGGKKVGVLAAEIHDSGGKKERGGTPT
jgi:hypothetical protein